MQSRKVSTDSPTNFLWGPQVCVIEIEIEIEINRFLGGCWMGQRGMIIRLGQVEVELQLFQFRRY